MKLKFIKIKMKNIGRFQFFNISQDSELWEEIHHPNNKMITASIVPDILGYGYQSRKKLYNQMKGIEKKIVTDYTTALMKYGKDNEPKAAEEFRKLFNVAQAKVGFIFHPEYNWLGCSPDRILKFNDSDYKLLEIKCPAKSKIPNSVEELPINYIIQCQVQLSCFPTIEGIFLYFWKPDENECFFLFQDEKFQNFIIDECKQFIESLEKENVNNIVTLKKKEYVKSIIDYSKIIKLLK